MAKQNTKMAKSKTADEIAQMLVNNFFLEDLAYMIAYHMDEATLKEILEDEGLDTSFFASTKKSKMEKTPVKKSHDGILMGRESLTLFKELIQSIKSEMGIDVGDDDGFDMLNQFYVNSVHYYNEMVGGEGERFYASTKKSKMKKTPIINLYGNDDTDTTIEIDNYNEYADVTAQEIEALAPSAEVIVDMGQVDVIWRLPSGNHPGLWITSHGKGRQGVHVSAKHFDYPDVENVSGFLDYIQDKYGRKSYELVNSGSGLPPEEIKEAITEMERELGQYALGTKMQIYNASTKKSKKPDLGISFEASVNSLRKTNYAKCGNINTIVKERK